MIRRLDKTVIKRLMYALMAVFIFSAGIIPVSAFAYSSGFAAYTYAASEMTWTVSQMNNSSGAIRGVCYGNGLFVGVEDYVGISTSSDGMNWKDVYVGKMKWPQLSHALLTQDFMKKYTNTL